MKDLNLVSDKDLNEEIISYKIIPEAELKAKANEVVYYRSSFGESFTPFAFVTINGKEIARKYAVEVKLNQTLGEHNTFELLVPSEAFGDKGTYPMDNSRELLGAEATIELKQFGLSTFVHSGKVTHVAYQVKNKYPYLKLTGQSPTWSMEDGRQCRSFSKMTLEQIVNSIIEPYSRNGLDVGVSPRMQDVLEYTVMSNETSFEFIRRLAIRYGEYFFWNGTKLIFGRGGHKKVKLTEGRDFHEYNLNMESQFQHFTYEAYDNTRATTHSIDSRSVSSHSVVNPFQRKAVSSSENIFPESYASSYPHGLLINGKNDLESAALRQKLHRQNTLLLTSRTDNPNLKLGAVAEMMAWVNKYGVFENEAVAIENYMITQITHHYSSKGYYNTFSAVPHLQEIAPYMDETAYPRSEQQSAIVIENDDPDGLNRVKVQFSWQKSSNQTTPWIKLLQAHAGAAYGMHSIPEKGNEVLIDFHGGNAEMPLVIGCLYNGEQKSEYGTPDNDIKAFKTRSGVKVEINDAQGSILIEDPSGNTYLMDGQGNINVNAPNNFTVNAGGDVNIIAGKNMNTNVGINNNTMVGVNNALTVSGNSQTYIAGVLSEDIKGDYNSHVEKAREEMSNGNSNFHSDKGLAKHSTKKLNNNSGEQSNLY